MTSRNAAWQRVRIEVTIQVHVHVYVHLACPCLTLELPCMFHAKLTHCHSCAGHCVKHMQVSGGGIAGDRREGHDKERLCPCQRRCGVQHGPGECSASTPRSPGEEQECAHDHGEGLLLRFFSGPELL